MSVTLNDIAASAGVNKTTVSKALRGCGDISARTRERIQALAAEMGYMTPTRKAGASRLIGVMCPEVASQYYSPIVEALNALLSADGYDMMLGVTGFARDREEALLKRFRHLSVDGVICMTEQADIGGIIREALGEARIPVIIIAINYEASAYDVISVDERVGIRRAVEQLASLGHRRIAFIGDHYVGNRLGYMSDALETRGYRLPPEYVAIGDQRNESCGYDNMRRLLALKTPPTAVIAGYDTIALGAYRAIVEAGLSVPGDVSLVGFDNAPMCSYLPVSLTSINSNAGDMCKIALAVMAKKIRNPDYQIIQTVAIQPEFVARESISVAKR